MATTPNLLITHIEANQSQKEVTANEAFDTLDEGLAGELVHNMASDANYTLDTTEPAKEHENLVLHITDTGVVLTAQRDIILPANKQLHVGWNDTAQTLRFKTATGAAFSVAAGSVRLFYIDAAGDAVAVADDSGGATFPNFTDLLDSPANYTGQAGKVVKVKGTEDGVEFLTESAATGVFWSLPYKGALVDLAADILAVNATSGYTVVWDTEVRDTDGLVDLGTNATRITIPSGVLKCRLHGAIATDNVSASTPMLVRVRKNGTTFQEWRQDIDNGYTNPTVQVQTPVLDVSATDYFELQISVSGDTNIDIKAGSYFELQVIETDTAQQPPYDLGFFYSGKPINSQEVFRMEAVRDWTHPDPGTGSTGEARVASTGNVAFSVKRNGTQYATVTFNISASGTWAFDAASDEAFSAGDTLTVVAPATADATLEDIAIFIKGLRNT